MKSLVRFVAAASLALPLAAQTPTVVPGFDKDAWLDRRGGLELRLDRDPRPEEGRLAVLLGETDVTQLFEPSPGRLTWPARSVPLPSGEKELVVYLVAPAGAWTELARIPVKVRTRGGFERASFRPALSVANKGQVAESQYPDSNTSLRSTFQDGTLQGGWTSELERGGSILRTQMNVTGVTYVNEALRFGEKGDHAPQVDLAGYTFELVRGPAKLAVGHVAFGGQRHLIGGFASRGALLTVGEGKRVSLHLAALNGTSIVGWDNFIGLSNQDHQMLGAGIGLEILLQPFDAYNQGAIRAAETSRGNAWRILMSDPSNRLSIEGGFSRSRFEDAVDVQLEEGLAVTPLGTPKRDAYYADATFALLRDRPIAGEARASVALGFHLEQVDPLYRSVAAYAQADVLRRSFDLTGSLGPLSVQLLRSTMEDNLEEIPSILKTLTDQDGATASLQLASLAKSERLKLWLPALAGSVTRIHQHGASIPVDSGFSAGHVPDQISRNATLGVDWMIRAFRIGYRWNASEQDNRQPGRERADFEAGSSGLSFGYAPTDRLGLGIDLSLDEQHSVESGRTDRTRRGGANVSWRLFGDVALAASWSRTLGRDDARTVRTGSADSYLELSSGFRLWSRAAGAPPPHRAFVRYANRSSDSTDLLLGTFDDRGGWTVSTGVTVSVLR
jgi:hypothetical protein